jgi:hypothetical protein
MLGNLKITNNCNSCGDCRQCPPPEMKLYYRLDASPTNPGINTSSTVFLTDPVINTYRGITNRFGTQNDFVTLNKNIITFIGYRTPKNPALPAYLQVPDLYNETLNFNVEPYLENFIQATASFADEGSDFDATIPFANYTVSAASGIFKGYTNVRINFYNDGNPPGFTGVGRVRIATIT